MNKLSAIIRERCPRCTVGPIFTSLFRMNPRCSRCGLEFEREQGYFVGAMYFSYALALVAVLPVIVAMLLLGFGAAPIYAVSCLVLIALSPFLFRYSRVIWIHLDQVIDPQPSHPGTSGHSGTGGHATPSGHVTTSGHSDTPGHSGTSNSGTSSYSGISGHSASPSRHSRESGNPGPGRGPTRRSP